MSTNIDQTTLRKADSVYTCIVNTIQSVNPVKLPTTRAYHMEELNTLHYCSEEVNKKMYSVSRNQSDDSGWRISFRYSACCVFHLFTEG
jgi:hypothetical protein